MTRPSPPGPWRRTGTRTVHRDRWVHLRAESWVTGNGTVLDVKSKLDRAQKPEGIDLWRL